MDTRIMFLRNAPHPDHRLGSPCGCLAISVDRRNHRLSYQYSVLNPADQFNRKLARQLAIGRLVESPITIACPRSENLSMHNISWIVMSHLAGSKAPVRAIKAANNWLDAALYTDCEY